MSLTRTLALNLGSATLKAAWFTHRRNDIGAAAPEAGARIEQAGARGASDRPDALHGLLDAIVPPGIAAPERIVHRIVHGGSLRGPLRIDATVRARLQQFAAWAPLHQPPALALIDAASRRWPGVPQFAAFDTDWHRTLPAISRTLPLSARLRALGLQRFGFHGLAFQSCWRQFAARAADHATRRVVFAHLGGGCSLCAVRDGCSIDTTMALTPLGGVPMASRSGDLDPGIVIALQRAGMDADTIEAELGQQSGLRGISGISGDVRELLASRHADARLAIDQFVLRIAQGIAQMAVGLGGIDDLLFSGGIGANAGDLRAAIVQRLGFLGLAAGDLVGADRACRRFDAAGSSARLWVVRVDEEFEMAAVLD